jgi:hypothetical protein
MTAERRAKLQQNARKPRRKPTADLREMAKRALEPFLAGPAFERIGRILAGEEGEFDQFRWAVEYASGRIGLPAITQQNVSVSGFAVQVNTTLEKDGDEAGEGVGVIGLGWPTGSTDALGGGDGQRTGVNGSNGAH